MTDKKLFLVFYVLSGVVGLYAAPEVVLPNGPIRGREASTIKNTDYFAFEKIPYAAPPSGKLRFKASVPPENWNEPLDTTHLDVTCYEQSGNSDAESEDCLYLSIFTAQLPKNTTELVPVMLFIHGGGFVGGAGNRFFGDRLLDEDIVFVVINYRLGPFGFLSTEDEVIPGNNGLKDQQLALKWTHDNIHLFGGDPEKITIFGQSAGAASCAYQLLNQQSKGLFRSAIMESGTFLSPWSFQRRAREIAFDTAAFLNDTFNTNRDSQTLLDFLQSVDAKDLDIASEQYYNSEYGPEDTEILQGFFWAPVVEVKNPDAFLTKKMYELFQAGNFLPIPIMIGITSEENLSFNQDADLLKSNMAAYDDHLGWLVPNDMGVIDETNRTEIGSKIREIYTGGEPLVDHLGDGVRSPQFSYDGELGRVNVHYDGAESVGHNEDIRYIFCTGTECDVSSYPESDQKTVERMVTIWTNFAKYQNPTPESSELLQNITWPTVDTKNGDFLYVDIGEDLEIKNHPKDETYIKWNQIYYSLGYTDFDTY